MEAENRNCEMLLKAEVSLGYGTVRLLVILIRALE